jgi:hypothetical protein
VNDAATFTPSSVGFNASVDNYVKMRESVYTCVDYIILDPLKAVEVSFFHEAVCIDSF